MKFSLYNTNSQECYLPVFSVHEVFYGQFAFSKNHGRYKLLDNIITKESGTKIKLQH